MGTHFQIAGVRPAHVSISAANCAIWLRQHEKQGPRDGHFSPKVTDAPGVRAHMSLHSAPRPDDVSTIFISPPFLDRWAAPESGKTDRQHLSASLISSFLRVLEYVQLGAGAKHSESNAQTPSRGCCNCDSC